MNAKSFNLSVQGASHIKRNKECQDASASYTDENMAIAIVCDGHGGDDYMRSASGSKLGCGAAQKNIKNFLNAVTKEQFMDNPEMMLKNLEASIINAWNEAIYSHFSLNPFTEAELAGVSEKARKKYVDDGEIESAYGTTMIAVAMTHEFWFGIHIGDGKCVAINPEGKFVQPIPWDPKCFLNATTSICDSDALDRFRHFYSEKLPVAVFVGSDGIDDCFSNNEQLNNLYKTVLYSFGTSEFDEAVAGLKDYLPRLSAKGSGDDVSIAAMMDLDLVPELDVVKAFDRDKEKARVEENARKEAEKNEAEKRRVEQEHAKFQRENNSKTPPERRAKFCTWCRASLKPGANFCHQCGKEIAPLDKKIESLQVTSMKRFDADNEDKINEPIEPVEQSESENKEENMENTVAISDLGENAFDIASDSSNSEGTVAAETEPAIKAEEPVESNLPDKQENTENFVSDAEDSSNPEEEASDTLFSEDNSIENKNEFVDLNKTDI